MKSLLIIVILLAFACNNDKKNEATKIETADTLPATPSRDAAPVHLDTTPPLNGTWELNLISPIGPKVNFTELYPGKIPFIRINADSLVVSGNTGCNNFNGKIKIDKKNISFNEPLAMTRMMCPGNGETVFVETLRKVNTWTITDDSTLHLIMGDIALMRFKRK